MTSLRPLGLDGEPPIDIPALIEARDAAAFRTIFPGGRSVTHSPANRVFLSGDGAARKELLETAMRPNGEVVLRSHGISEEARLALRDAEAGIFLEQRRIAIQNAVRAMGDRLAEWGANDRPTIAYLLARGEGGN